MTFQDPESAAGRLAQLAREFMSGPENDAGMPAGPEPAYEPPLLGVAAGDDPLWLTFKAAVGPEHWTPLEAFRQAFPGEAAAENLSVLCWILPQTEATLRDQRAAGRHPCERWARNRHQAQPKVVEGLARFLLQRLDEAGIRALAPDLLPAWQWVDSARFVISSRWSQRHAAFAAGLGTFGLCDGLITPLGKAMRCGSLVAELKLPVSPRPYAGIYDYCLFYNSGGCGRCIKRCPGGAISKAGHDKALCKDYLYGRNKSYITSTWPDLSGAYACGLCQAGVPCERGIPRRAAASAPLLSRAVSN
ncbi:MAG: hypothetical protein LBS31_03350 [Candidatus Adiutrix sp.]|jgi:epoxyqueuosine reductase QueG|nr:hypothetical protein [Candidatus Adiutrix sp.]